MQVAECLLVHVLSSSSNVSSLELWNERKTTGFGAAKDNELNQVPVCHERVYVDKVVREFWFVKSFSPQHHSELIANIAIEKVSKIRTKICKSRSLPCKVNLYFLRFSTHFNSDKAFDVIVSFLNENVHGLNRISVMEG